ncbi:MAG: XRE family transcriptional regulator [Wolbachia sp.]|nr:XRE family transcriptional regulator [Wolbachia sp.]MDD9336416.1 XRE family transcriptional regulator [Wolbachia sp.]
MQDSGLGYSIVIELDEAKDIKLRLMEVVAEVTNKRYGTQKKAASILKIDQPKVSWINKLKI